MCIFPVQRVCTSSGTMLVVKLARYNRARTRRDAALSPSFSPPRESGKTAQPIRGREYGAEHKSALCRRGGPCGRCRDAERRTAISGRPQADELAPQADGCCSLLRSERAMTDCRPISLFSRPSAWRGDWNDDRQATIQDKYLIWISVLQRDTQRMPMSAEPYTSDRRW